MNTIAIVPARFEHIRPLAANMRQADVDEVFASGGQSPAGALSYSIRHSSHAWTGLIDGKPVLMFGIVDANILTGTGVPWLLATPEIETRQREFLKRSIGFRDQLLGRYSVLRNFVDVRNVVSIRWLTWLGFKLLDRVEMRGHEFRLFELRSSDV
jgi:hypothetical protein